MSERTESEIIAYAYSPEHMLLRAPVQGYQGGIPWPIHLEAYEVYCHKYARQTALIDLQGRGCRGGFGTCELDMFIPGWRERVNPITEMQQRLSAAERELSELRKEVESYRVQSKCKRCDDKGWIDGHGPDEDCKCALVQVACPECQPEKYCSICGKEIVNELCHINTHGHKPINNMELRPNNTGCSGIPCNEADPYHVQVCPDFKLE